MKRQVVRIGVAVLLLGANLPAFCADWPRFLGPDGTGVSSETGWKPESLSKGPKIAWQKDVGNGYSGVAVKDGRVYTMGNRGNNDTVFCFNEADGKEIWSKSYPCKVGQYPGPKCTPTVDGARLYTVSSRALVSCFDASEGGVLWQTDAAAEFGAKPPQWRFATSVRSLR